MFRLSEKYSQGTRCYPGQLHALRVRLKSRADSNINKYLSFTGQQDWYTRTHIIQIHLAKLLNYHGNSLAQQQQARWWWI